MQVFLNGHFVPEERAVIPVNDRGFLLGDGLFETVRVTGGRPFRFITHLERLARGAAFLKIRLPFPPRELEAFAGQLIKKHRMPEAVLRLTLTRGPGGRGYAPGAESKPTIVMTLQPLPPANPAGWRLVTSSFRVPAGDPLASFKTTSKILHVMARAEAIECGADEALLLNTNGEVAETAGGNLFWVQDDTVCTVPVEAGILPGVTRSVVLEICRSLNLKIIERTARPAELQNSTGIFITQSVQGVVPATRFNGAPMPQSPLVPQITRVYGEWLALG